MMLSEKQRLFASTIARFQIWIIKQGYEFTYGDAYRDPRVFGKFGDRAGYGAPTSCHKLRLALDINLFVDGEYITDGDHPAYKALGEKWESMHALAKWGGRFNDANHFSFAHGRHA